MSPDIPGSSGPNSPSRRALLAGLGTLGLAGGTGLGYRAWSTRTDETDVTRRLTVDDEFSLDETGVTPVEDSDRTPRRKPSVSHRCDPDPGRIDSTSYSANFSMIDAWNERYHLWRTADGGQGGDGSGSENESDGDDTDGPGVSVQNSVTLEKAPERVDGSYLYGSRLYSLAHVEDGHLSRHRIRRLEIDLRIDPAIEVRTVLPTGPIDPESGVCTLTLLRELPSGWNAGYERTTWVNEGTVDTAYDRDANRVTLSFTGDSSMSESMLGLLELRTDRPITAFDEPFTWTVRGTASRRGL